MCAIPKRFRVSDSFDAEMRNEQDTAAVRLLRTEAIRDNDSRRSRIALHNERFLRMTLKSTETHNRRLSERMKKPRNLSGKDHDAMKNNLGHVKKKLSEDHVDVEDDHVEILLQDYDTGIVFEAVSHRPVVRTITASAGPNIRSKIRPGMILAKIAGVRVKEISYQATLNLLRALDRPLRLTFKLKRSKRKDQDYQKTDEHKKKKRRKQSSR
uniref:PDZ domain-containing protein n=1 Tax=Aureoumbra lagunensis TaxID=44058 RepID=A0A7S3K177_9STRA